MKNASGLYTNSNSPKTLSVSLLLQATVGAGSFRLNKLGFKEWGGRAGGQGEREGRERRRERGRETGEGEREGRETGRGRERRMGREIGRGREGCRERSREG